MITSLLTVLSAAVVLGSVPLLIAQFAALRGDVRRSRASQLVAQNEQILIGAVLGGRDADEGVEALRAVPAEARPAMIAGLADFAGEALDRLVDIARRSGALDAAGRDLYSRRADRRCAALDLLTRLRLPGRRAEALLSDRDPAVRAAALRWRAALGGGSAAGRVVGALIDVNPGVRFAVYANLDRLGPAGIEEIALRSTTGCELDAAGVPALATQAVNPAIRRYLADAAAASADPLRQLAAIRALARFTAPPAHQQLRDLLDHRSAAVRRTAATAVGAARDNAMTRRLAVIARHDSDPLVRDGALNGLRQLGIAGQAALRGLADAERT